ncbi:MAG: 8-oxo-dGTP diphosphatase [Candidatus Micrarchaeia archaeon]
MPDYKTLDDYKKEYPRLRDVTLCYLIDKDNEKILLAMKKRGFGVGKLNGVGGKLKEGESVEQALIRETEEEVGVMLREYEKVAKIDFYFDNDKNKDMNQTVHVYLAYKWDGTPSESEEMKPEWQDINKLDYSKMWSDDRYWLGIVLEGMYVRASFLFGENDKIKEFEIEASNRSFERRIVRRETRI